MARDAVDVFAFHVNVPPAATSLDVEFQFTSPSTAEGRVVMTPEMLNLQWNTVRALSGRIFTRQITVEPSVRLPDGWQFATALETASTGGVTRSSRSRSTRSSIRRCSPAATSRRVDLDPGGRPGALEHRRRSRRTLDVKPDQLEPIARWSSRPTSCRLASLRSLRLSARADGSHGGTGSSTTGRARTARCPTYFTAWERNTAEHDLLPHEYTHSWNGKFRRPADLWTPNFNVPMRDSLLWVYEGQTEYWGYVLAARRAC